MKKLILTFILLNISVILYPQYANKVIDSRPQNSIYLNLLGDASIFSFNYDRIYPVRRIFLISGKIGLGYNREQNWICLGSFGKCPSIDYITVPHHITGNLGKGRHFFEFGFGGTLLLNNPTSRYSFYPIIGYRFLPVWWGKFNIRIFAHIPIPGIENVFGFPGGLSIGKSF